MRNIVDILESKEPDIPEKDRKELERIVCGALEDLYNESDSWTDAKVDEFIKNRFKDSHWSDSVISGISDICKKAIKNMSKYEDRLKQDNKVVEMDLSGRRESTNIFDNRLKLSEEELRYRYEYPFCDPYTGKRYKTEKELNDIIDNREKEWGDKYSEYNEKRDNLIKKSKSEINREKADAIKSASDRYVLDLGHGRTKTISAEEYRRLKAKTGSKETVKVVPHKFKDYIEYGGEGKSFHQLSSTVSSVNTNEYTVKTRWGRFIDTDGPKKTAIIAGVAAATAITVAVLIHVAKKQNENVIAGLKQAIEDERDPDKRKSLESDYDNMLRVMYRNNGKIRIDPDFEKIPESDRKDFEKKFSSIACNKTLAKSGKEYIKKNGSDFIDFDRDRTFKSSPKEQIVKAKDGSEIHARRKKTGRGMTYVRTRNGKEVGYATKDEFRSARHNEGMISLKRILLESFE